MDYEAREHELCSRYQYTGKEKDIFLDGYRHGRLDAQIEDLKQQVETLKEVCNKHRVPFPDAETR